MKEIFSMYDEILAGNVINPASYFEWNTLKVFEHIGGYKALKPNFTMDHSGKPTGNAKPGVEDILIEYSDFSLLIECSLRTGSDQLDYEGDSVVRHLKNYKKTNTNKAICLFLSSKIDLSFAKHVSFEKDKYPVLPLTVRQFERLVNFYNIERFSPQHFLDTLNRAIREDLDFTQADEWLEYIDKII